MATEVCSEKPRLSLSSDLPPADATSNSQQADAYLPLDLSAGEFNFSIGFQISAYDSSIADELFSDGKILPYFKTPAPAAPTPALPTPQPVLDRDGRLRELIHSGDDNISRRGSRLSFWRFSRSNSLGNKADPCPILPFSLLRSKSTSSVPNPARRRSAATWSRNIPVDSNQRKTYYYSSSQRGSCGGGVRISPVLNFPAPMISRGGSGGGSGENGGTTDGLFAFLLCSCGGAGRRDEIRGKIQRNGTGRTGIVA